jgi:type II secretory pathway pseudopilin PulG
MKKVAGFSMVETLLFIVIIGVLVTGTLSVFNTVLVKSRNLKQLMTASQLADARMNIILQQRLVNGFSAISDPCNAGSPPAVCSALTTFASNNGYQVSSTITTGNTLTSATVNVTGTGSASVIMSFQP